MFDSKFIATLVALVAAVFAITSFNNRVTSNEGFLGMGSMTVRKERVAAANHQAAAKGDFYSVPGTFQSQIAPRFSNTQYGSSIRYNLPDQKHMASPSDPLTFSNMAKENYTPDTVENYGCGSCAGQSCGADKAEPSYHAEPLMDANYAAGDYHEVAAVEHPSMEDMIPVGDMTTMNADGEVVQPIMFDRLMIVNRNSRMRGLGDYFRGDLSITPCAEHNGWFKSHHGVEGLNPGAMAVMGGINNESTKALASLINDATGSTTLSGVDMASMRNVTTGQSMADINTVAYP